MAEPINFDDELDYIFIANDSGPNTYFISNDVTTTNSSGTGEAIRPTATATATAAAITTVTATILSDGIKSGRYVDTTQAVTVATVMLANATSTLMGSSTTSTTTTATTMPHAVTASSSAASVAANVNSMTTSISAAALVAAENVYNGVAIDLGNMLINDSMFMDFNATIETASATSIFGEFINGSDLMTTSNATNNVTSSDDDFADYIRTAATTVILGLMILVTIIGNVFVIAAIILERNLQNVANYLVASLAVADLFVACLVMPLGAVYEISQGWILGPELCDIWTSCDVLCCTASILHLVAIAVDRYWAVTNIDYIHSRTSKRVFLMIFFVWTAAVIVSLAPQFGWKDPDYLQRIEQQKCMVSQDIAYQVFATCCTFYVPLLVILALYWKIYQTARKRIHRRRPKLANFTANNNQPDLTAQKKRNRLRLRLGKLSATSHEKGNRLTATTGTSLGLVEGNSTNTVNTVEDTEFSSSNVDSKSRAGLEVTTTNFSTNIEEIPTTSNNQITTVSHLVAIANQQQNASTKVNQTATEQKQTTNVACINNSSDKTTATKLSMAKSTTTTSTPMTMTTPTAPPKTIMHNSSNHNRSNLSHNPNRVSITLPMHETNGDAARTATTTPTTPTATAMTDATIAVDETVMETIETTTSNMNNISSTANGIEVLEDPQLQQQLQQVQEQQQQQQQEQQEQPMMHRSNTVGGGCGAASTSNATTITSISALSPQTPSTQLPTIVTGLGGTGSVVAPLQHPLAHGVGIGGGSSNASNQVTPIPKPKHQQQQLSSIANPMHKVTKRKETLEAKRERKAAKTLAIITGAFVVCWLPFFAMALLLPLCDGCEISDSIASLFLWLGYFNSTLNPVIYTIFSPEFRQAFKRILFGGHRPMHYRSGKI